MKKLLLLGTTGTPLPHLLHIIFLLSVLTTIYGESKSGYDVAKYIVEHKINIGSFRVHSQNPVGKFNIEQLMERYGYIKVY